MHKTREDNKMPGTVIGTSLNYGFIGKVSRNGLKEIGARFVKSILDGNGAETLVAIPFGFPTVLNTDNTYSKWGDSGSGVSAATVANFGGFAVAEVKQVLTYNTNAAGEYSPGQVADVLQKGSITVKVVDYANNAPTAGGQVYICSAVGNGSLTLGHLYATATPTGIGSGTVLSLTGAKFTTGKVDANGVCEVTLQSQMNV
jgi:hypothetical protein